ncbi:MAG: nitrogenase molybdenum-iron protein subunit beta, partial [Deltaproteobacteria bacterium]|nr:nitrogenase molybdenum-iron protein subunit beta [Deltaproteobacteria bacterium]
MLSMTPKEITERKALRINPAKTCQPIGAMYAALGIHGCLPHSHGSQGCYAYHRSHLTRHFREPVMASTSSFTEGASVFGGAPNLRQALKNIFQIYDPDVVAVHTTCLSETIGDDLPSIIKKAKDDGIIPDGKWVIHTNTPSYVGSHVTGFSNMVRGIVDYFSTSTGETKNRINVIPGYVEPSDMREIKRMTEEMGVKSLVFP